MKKEKQIKRRLSVTEKNIKSLQKQIAEFYEKNDGAWLSFPILDRMEVERDVLEWVLRNGTL